MRRSKFALSICLILSAVIGLSVLSSCGGGGGSRPVTKPGDEVIITPPGNRAPVVSQAFENVVLPPSSGRSRWESQPLANYFSDPDGDTLEFRAQVDNSNVASVEISNTGSLVLHIQGSTTATITVTAQDSDRLSVEQSFTVTVSDRTVTPPPDHSDTPAGATDIFSGQTVEGHINSPEDVDYFRLQVAEPSTVTVTLDSEVAGVQISLLDDDGNVLAVAETESAAALLATVGVGLYLIEVALSPNPPDTAVVGWVFYRLGLLAQAPLPRQFHPPHIRPGTLLGACECLTFIQPGARKQEIHLADIIENPHNNSEDGLIFESFRKIQNGYDGLTYKFDHDTSLLTIEPSTTADVGLHKFEVTVTGVTYYERLVGNNLVSVPAFVRKILEFKVNVWAIPRWAAILGLLPGESLDMVVQAGKSKSKDLDDVIGPPAHVGYTPKIMFELDTDTPIPGANASRLLRAAVGTNPNSTDPAPYRHLSVSPPSDLRGYHNLQVSAWFPNTERSADFTFRVIVGGPRIIPGSPPLSVSVPVGGSGEINLTNYIEDPLGGPLTFTPKSVPSGFRVATSGSQWTIQVGEDMEPGEYDITLTATDSNDFSDDFALEVTLGCQAQVVFNDHDRWTPSRSFTSTLFLSQYTGDCKNGRANGRQGTFVASNATGQSLSYVGEWEDGEPRGEGKWHINTILSERHYEGEWQDRRPHGVGTGSIEYAYGDTQRYSGEWVDGLPHGQGTWTALEDGDRYRYFGEFRNGLQHGRGVETNTYANGDRERLDGEFRNDVLWNGTSTWNGESCRVVNGVWC